MPAYTPILHIPQVAPGQADKETTINTGLAILEAAGNDSLISSAAAGDVVLNQDQFTKYMLHRVQGHTVSRNLWIPDTKRFFVVSNEGTAAIVVRPNGSASGSVNVPAAKISLISTDGDTIRMISTGASLLTDLSDVDIAGSATPNEGDVLKYLGGYWVPGSFSSSTFLGLADTPDSYTSQGSKLVRVNAGATALEFATANTGILTDFPAYSSLLSGRLLAVNAVGNGLEYVAPAAGGVIYMSSIQDVEIPSDIVDGYVLTYVQVGNYFEFKPQTGGGAGAFTSLTDCPAAYTGSALKYVRVKADLSGLEFATLPSFVTSLGQLSDVELGTGLTDGDILRYIDGIWQADPFPGVISLPIGSIVGKPANAELISRIVMVDSCIINVGAPGSQAKAAVASAGNVAFDVKKNGASVATVTFNTSATGVFTAASTITLAPGDVLSLVAPATQDANLEDISITLRAKRS